MNRLIRIDWRLWLSAATIVASLSWLHPSAAAEKLRVGRADSTAFGFTVIDIGLAEGIFQRAGIDIESLVLSGDAKVHQALAANAIDIGLASGPSLAFIVKGSPALGIAALANAPNIMALVVPNNGAVKTIADLKGRTISVTTVGSLTEWLVRELSRQQGWGPDGIRVVALGDNRSVLAALKTGQVDGISAAMPIGLRLEKEKTGHILVYFGKIVKDFHVQVIYATLGILKTNPTAVRSFLKAWFETVAFMRSHKDDVIRIAAPVVKADPDTFSTIYDATMPDLSTDGRFEAKALARLSQSFVDLKQLPDPPDMQKLVTEAYLPGPR